ncbi:MAG: 16S rRNA (cytosine(967)-C(5))-methyltransferase RsmB [Bacillota bacterium]
MGNRKTAREAALLALLEIDEQGAYAAIARDRALASAGLSERDRALATELIYGVTKYRKTLDHIIGTFASRPVAQMDPPARNVLRLGAYQVFYLTHVPPPAAVSESVKLARVRGHEGMAAFVNAVLRAMVRDPGKVRFPDAATEPVAHVAVKYSHPEWMVSRWIERFGLEEAMRLCDANNERPPVTIRLNVLKVTQAQVMDSLAAAGIAARPSRYVPEAIEVQDGADLFLHPLYRDGAFFVQDTSSMLVAYVLDPEPGDTVLDLAAAPGGKATHMAERMGDRGTVVAVDIHEHRTRLVEQNADRLGLRSIKAVCADATKLPPAVTCVSFDKVLVDAPCSGTGVLRRRPDLRWHRQPKDLEELVPLQVSLLSSGAERVKPGGAIVYSTCSIEPEENSLIIKDFLKGHEDFSPDPALPYLPDTFSSVFPRTGLPFVETLPHIHGMDGFFIARLIRSASR